MGEIEEESFPRGGTRPRLSTKRPREDDNLFSSVSRPKTKKHRREKKIEIEAINDDTFHSSLNIRGILSFNTIKTDMIVLGCIRHITNFGLELELPGLTFGHVNVTNISDPFTKYLNSKLEGSEDITETLLTNVFKKGQFVLTKIINLESRDKGLHVECSLNPREIYIGKSHSSFEKEMLVWGCVHSELEHGYQINIGVKYCRVFLPSKNVDAGKQLVIGEPIWCKIHKCEISNAASTLRVSCRSDHLKNANVEEIKSLHDLIPGMQLQVVVDKVTENGLQVKFLNDFFGYIDSGQLAKHLSKYQEGNLLTAFILFIDHTVKVTYFTTFNLDIAPTPNYENGDIVMAEVISKAHNGLYLKLPSKERCLVTNKRLINSLPKKNPTIDIRETVRQKFPLKSRHNCRILDYNHMSRTYIGTMEQSLLKEKLFSPSDATPGQLVDVVIRTIQQDGLVVSAGHTRGFVPNLYLSNVKYSEPIKKKFKEGQKLKARVLTVHNSNVIFTLKQSQVESDKCLTDAAEAKRGDRYPGVIIQTKLTGAAVVFYGNVRGWISKKYLDEQDDDQKPDPQLFFFVGQVVNPWVLGVKNDKIILSLRQPKDFENFGRLDIGQRISGVISDIKKDRIHVKTTRGRPVGFIPLNHLSSSLSLCPVLIKTFKVGDQIDDLICINNGSPNLLSRREALALKRSSKLRLVKFNKLKAGNFVRCSYLSDCPMGIYVLPLILGFTEKILIRKKDIINKGASMPSFQPSQCIVTKIIEIEQESKKLRLSAKFADVFDNSVESVLDLFSERLTDFQTIYKYGRENDWDICQYRPGERIDCVVEKLGEHGGCLVKLPNGVNGLVAPRLCPDNLEEGQTVSGSYLSQNFAENYAEICLKPDICQRINPIQDGVIQHNTMFYSSCIAETILVKSDCIILRLKKKYGNRQLVHVPLFFHENDFESCKQYYEKDKVKICICAKVDNFLIGMSKKLFVTLDKVRAITSQGKTLRKEFDKGLLELSPKTCSSNGFDTDDTNNSKKDSDVPDEMSEDEELAQEESEYEKLANGESEDEKQTDEESEDEKLANGESEDEKQTDEESEDEKLADVESEDEKLADEEPENEKMEDDEAEIEEVSDQSGGGEVIADENDLLESEDSDQSNNEEENQDEDKHGHSVTFGDISVKEFSTNDSITGPLPGLSGVNSFFCTNTPIQQVVSSSDDEIEETGVKKKKKLTASERAQLAREEEERISKIEKDLADSSRAAENAEQFDRFLLANPNSSELWTKYIAFHTAATEFDKARAVAKRALDSINMTLIDEKFNIWMAMLNLENMCGTKESFDKTFEEAVRYNDSLKVYLNVIQLFAEHGKLADMEEKIKKVKNKHKQVPQMWLEIAKTYYQLGKFKEARNMKDGALKSISNKKTQLELIVRFAIMEFKFGDEDHGAAVFETIISSDPRQVRVWTVYVDQLVKKNKIDQARQVLERSICQRLPAKCMKTLFLKFRVFEEQYGTTENVEMVKEKAKEYVSKVSV